MDNLPTREKIRSILNGIGLGTKLHTDFKQWSGERYTLKSRHFGYLSQQEHEWSNKVTEALSKHDVRYTLLMNGTEGFIVYVRVSNPSA